MHAGEVGRGHQEWDDGRLGVRSIYLDWGKGRVETSLVLRGDLRRPTSVLPRRTMLHGSDQVASQFTSS